MMAFAERPRVILVLGCHRSGTSLVARSLTCLGAQLGERAEWVGLDNPTGFHEHQDVLAVNQLLLSEIGATWDSSAPWGNALAVFRALSPASIRIGLVAERILRRETARFPVFAIKEPRLGRLLPFWRPILTAIGADVSIVHVTRHPLAVAASLNRRNGIAIERGVALWVEHTKRAWVDSDPEWPCVTVSYDALVASPLQQIERIGAAMKLTIDADAAEDFGRSFVEKSLSHHAAASDGPMSDEARALWKAAEATSAALPAPPNPSMP